jgi:hypothetical protein
MTLGAVPTTKETSATVKETPSRVMEMPPSWQVMKVVISGSCRIVRLFVILAP